MSRDVAIFVGSLRVDSWNRKMAHAIVGLAPPSLALSIVEIGDLPLYNHDLEAAAPASWTALRARIKACDAVLFVTPEYNRSIPGALKNAIDVGSRPAGQSAWRGKPAAIVSVAPGLLGAFGANHHLRQAISCLDMPVLPAPEVYMSNVATLFDPSGALTAPTHAFLTKFIAAFAAWIEATAREPEPRA